MVHSKHKGDRAEREAAAMISDLLGFTVTRRFGAGQEHDTGDLVGVPDTTIQVADWTDLARAVRAKPVECETQQVNAGSTFGATLLRSRTGIWRVALTPSQWATYCRESLP